jgi:hypothetical protein
MSWQAYHRRRAAIAMVLDHAQHNPNAGLPFDELPEVTAVFASRSDLLRALQQDWSQALWAQIELVSIASSARLTDAAHVCRQAWALTEARRPVLRRLLDEYPG